MPSLEQFKSAMVLSAVGDALGYKNGSWEFCHNGEAIHKELETLGGLDRLDVRGWRVSDDTILHIATAEALVSDWSTTEELYPKIAAKYKDAMEVGTDRTREGEGGGVLPNILGGGVPHGQNPDPISDQNV